MINVYKFHVGLAGRELLAGDATPESAEAMTTGDDSCGHDDRGDWFRAWVDEKPPKAETDDKPKKRRR